MPKKISIILWGSIHRDPYAIKVLNEFIFKTKQNGCPVVFCDEDFAEQTLENRLKGLNQFLFLGNTFINQSFIQSLLKRKKELQHPYFELVDGPIIEQMIMKNFPKLSPPVVKEYTNALLRYNAFQEAILQSKLLIELNIPLIGIESSQKLREEMRAKIKDDRDYLEFERSRIETMTQSILEKGCAKIPDNGIIIVACGVNHVRGLTANIWQKKQELVEKYDIKLFPTKLFSSYVMDGLEIHLNAEQHSKKYYTEKTLQAYDKVLYQQIFCQDTIANSQGLTSIFNDALTHAQDKSKYSIANNPKFGS